MSDDAKNAGKNARNAQHDEPGDEVEAHGHGIKKSGPDFKNA